MYEELFSKTFPGFVSLRDSAQRIIYLNQNFRDWIAAYTKVDPIGKTNVELASIVPLNVADTFLQCHDASLDLQKRSSSGAGLKKIIDFKSESDFMEDSLYYDVLKYRVMIDNEPHIFTIAYDITELYIEN